MTLNAYNCRSQLIVSEGASQNTVGLMTYTGWGEIDGFTLGAQLPTQLAVTSLLSVYTVVTLGMPAISLNIEVLGDKTGDPDFFPSGLSWFDSLYEFSDTIVTINNGWTKTVLFNPERTRWQRIFEGLPYQNGFIYSPYTSQTCINNNT